MIFSLVYIISCLCYSIGTGLGYSLFISFHVFVIPLGPGWATRCLYQFMSLLFHWDRVGLLAVYIISCLCYSIGTGLGSSLFISFHVFVIPLGPGWATRCLIQWLPVISFHVFVIPLGPGWAPRCLIQWLPVMAKLTTLTMRQCHQYEWHTCHLGMECQNKI